MTRINVGFAQHVTSLPTSMIAKFQDQFIKSGVCEVKLPSVMKRKAAFALAALLIVITTSLQHNGFPLSKARYQPSAVAVGPKAFFAGGDNDRKVFKK